MALPRKIPSEDKSTVIGTTRLAEIYGKSRKWARGLLVEWKKVQDRGGPIRVFKRGKKGALYTTISILQREMPQTRDQTVVRQILELNRDFDTLARRVDVLTTELLVLRKMIEPTSGARLISRSL